MPGDPRERAGAVPLTEEQVRRYARHIVLAEVGGRGQACLLASGALVVGAGGLGSPAALYLAAAGVGRVGLCDPDVVDATNLHRQVLFGASDLGRAKVDAGRARLAKVNPDVRIETHAIRVTSDNARGLVARYDVILDGTDDLATKFALNDAAVALARPIVLAGVVRLEGQVLAVRPRETACYRCVFEEPPPVGLVPACEEAGVLGPAAGVVGSLQAVEALKLLLGIGPRGGRILIYDAVGGTVREVEVRRRPDCRACSRG